jgi:hypothetical protein
MAKMVGDFSWERMGERGVGTMLGYPRDGMPVPVVPNVKTDPDVPPLPSHIALQQAKNFTSTLVDGDPDESHLIADTARPVFSAVLPSIENK